MVQTISLLGSTGSIGRQSLDVIAACGMEAVALAANSSVSRMEEQARQYRPRIAALADEKAAADLRVRLADTNVQVLSGLEGVLEAATISSADTAIAALVGMAGLRPALASIREGKRVCLANKEALVCAGMGGRLMMRILGEEKAKTDSFTELILQPQSEIMQFRTWLREQGLRITDETMVEEDGKFYPMMRAVPEAGALTTEAVDEIRCSDDSALRKSAVYAECGEIRGMKQGELCKLYDRYGGFLLQRGDSTLLAFLQKEERIYTEILDRLQGQGLDCDRRRMRYAEVEKLLAECRKAKEIALRGAGCGS